MHADDAQNNLTFEINQLDVFMLTMDEPNAELHWSLLLELCPWAARIHGVKGFDAAHRAAAEQSQTDWFITVDADNIVYPHFFDQVFRLEHDRQCLSFNGLNMVNGLQYGNGGLKVWSKQFVRDMRTHENSHDPMHVVDFCWSDSYHQVQRTYSEVWSNGSPYQAFRAGFREGIKLSLDRGMRVKASNMQARLHPFNLRNLKVWCCIGSDCSNGMWGMFGARTGWLQMCDLKFEHHVTNDFDWFQEQWQGIRDTDVTFDLLTSLGRDLEIRTGIVLPCFSPAKSKFFRETWLVSV